MKQIPWNDKYSVGVKEIDLQHRGLLDIINKTIHSIEENKEWPTTSALLDSLIHYAYTHFATEERYMKEADYPDLTWHIRLHLEFIRKIFAMSEDAASKGSEMEQEILAYLGEWYNDHILGIDRKYMASLAAKGIK